MESVRGDSVEMNMNKLPGKTGSKETFLRLQQSSANLRLRKTLPQLPQMASTHYPLIIKKP